MTRILTEKRKPLGYLDVAGLKAKWEAGQVDPVIVSSVNTLFFLDTDIIPSIEKRLIVF